MDLLNNALADTANLVTTVEGPYRFNSRQRQELNECGVTPDQVAQIFPTKDGVDEFIDNARRFAANFQKNNSQPCATGAFCTQAIQLMSHSPSFRCCCQGAQQPFA
jgi:hypothetical protein